VGDLLVTRKRIRKRTVLTIVVAAGVVGLCVWTLVRGTWADTEPRNPATSSDGIVRQLLLTKEGRKDVRCAVVLDASPEAVWKIVTDYEHFETILPHLGPMKVVREPDGHFHLTGNVTSPLGDFPIDTRVAHHESPDVSTASWDQPGGRMTVNRGSWTLTRQGPSSTLVVYTLDTEVPPFPAFMVRCVLLHELKVGARCVAAELARRKG
jgi:uncharacterized membrane protein